MSRRAGGVRVKGWGKSPPRAWQQGRQGKPHREQDRIGMTRVLLAALQPVSGPVIRVGCVRQRANAVPDEWLPRSGVRVGAIQNPAYRPTGNFILLIVFNPWAVSSDGGVAPHARCQPSCGRFNFASSVHPLLSPKSMLTLMCICFQGVRTRFAPVAVHKDAAEALPIANPLLNLTAYK